MKNLIFFIAFLTFVVVGSAFGQSAVNKTTPLTAGATAPDFTLSGTDGRSLTLSKIKQPTVLVFYRGYW